MLKQRFTREEYASRKEQRKKIYEIIFAFVDLSDDYWISFKKLRKVLKHSDDIQIFFAPYVGKDGKFIASKLDEFNTSLDKMYEVIMAKQKILEEEIVAKMAANPNASKQPKVKVVRPKITEHNAEDAPRQRIRRVRLTPEQKVALEEMKKEKNQ
jgi:hypothetical protein